MSGVMVEIRSVSIWKVLRHMERCKEPVSGAELRRQAGMQRHTKDGTWLDDLVADGLIKNVTRGVLAGRGPQQHLRSYVLTAKGQYAAEHGEYVREGA